MLTHVGLDVWTGSKHECGVPSFSRTVHIWRDDQVGPGTCEMWPMREMTSEDHLWIEYKDGDAIPVAAIDAVKEFAREPGKLLVHCAAGMGRSATLAIVALASRLRLPGNPWPIWDALKNICERYYEIHGQAPNILPVPLQSVAEAMCLREGTT